MNHRALFVLIVFLSHKDLYAYVDPGTGSLLLQALFAAFATVYFSFSRFKNFLKDFISKRRK